MHHNLVSLSPDLCFRVSVEFLHSLNHLILYSTWRSITDDVQDSVSNAGVRILDQVEHPHPELGDVLLAPTRTKEFDSLQSNIVIFMGRIPQHFSNILRVADVPHKLLLIDFGSLGLLLVGTSFGHYIYYVIL